MTEEKLKLAQELSQTGSWELDIINNKLWWSDEVYRLFGMQPQEFEATYESFLDYIHPDDREMVNKAYTQSLKDKKPYEITHRLKLKDGSIMHVIEKCKSFFDKKENPLKSIGTVQDITDEVLAKKELIKSEERLKLATDAGQVGIWDWDIKGNKLIWDKSMYNLYGIKKEDYKNAEDARRNGISPNDLKRVNFDIQQALMKSQNFQSEFKIKRPDGVEHIIKASADIYRNTKGEAYRMVGVNLDITEQKNTERELRNHQENLENLVKKRSKELEKTNYLREIERIRAQNYLDIAGVMIIALDQDQHIQLVNKKGCEVLEYTENELIGKNWHEMSKTDNGEKSIKRSILKKLDIKTSFESENEYYITTKNGIQRLITWHNTPIYDKDKNVIGTLSSGEDVTKRRKAEEELKNRANELETLNKAMLDREMRIIEIKEEVNKLAEELGRNNPYPAIWKDKE